MDIEGITFASLLTAAGAAVAAAIITSTVELIKRVFAPPASGAAMAFFLSALLYIVAAVATGAATLDAGLGVFLAWLACASAAVGIHATIRTATR